MMPTKFSRFETVDYKGGKAVVQNYKFEKGGTFYLIEVKLNAVIWVNENSLKKWKEQ